MQNFEQIRGHLNKSGYKVTMQQPYVACVELSLDNGSRHQAIFLSELGNDDERSYLRVSTVIAPITGVDTRRALGFNWESSVGYLAIGDLDGGAEALANYFTEKWSRIEAFARTGVFEATEDYGLMLSDDELLASGYVRPRVELDEVADQDWMQMAWLLRYECRDLFIEMLLVLRAKARAHDLGEGDEQPEEEDDGKFETSETDRGNVTPAARTSDEESAI